MKKVIIKFVVEIDGVDHNITMSDVSESIHQAIQDGAVEDTTEEIIEYATQDC